MKVLGEYLSSRRKAKRISTKSASRDLNIKKEKLEALESGNWESLPEPTFVKGFLKNYAKYLGLDPDHVLALYRREYDEARYPHKRSPIDRDKRYMFTPNKLAGLVFILATLIFFAYVSIQYLSILSAPKLRVNEPPDDYTTTIPFVQISGQTEKEATVAIAGEFVPVDTSGYFSYQIKLNNGRNDIEIIASKKLSPKSKIIKTIRLLK